MDDETIDLAYDVLTLAQDANMPDTFWHTDERIKRAVEVLGITTDAAMRGDWKSFDWRAARRAF